MTLDFTIETPSFDIAVTPSYVIAAGGGGEIGYGKKNGIFILLKNTPKHDKGNEQGGLKNFYNTEELIHRIHVRVEGEAREEFEEDDLSCENNSDLEVDSDIEVGSDMGVEPAAPELGTAGPDDEQDRVLKSNHSQSSTADAEEKQTEQQPERQRGDTYETVYIIALSDSHFYMLEYNGQFRLLLHKACSVKAVHFTNNLLLLAGGTVYGFADILQNLSSFRIEKKGPAIDSTDEEYFYKLYKRKNKIVYRREFGTSDVPDDNWSGFFVHNGKIHKVLYSNGLNTFVYNNRKYSYEGEISSVRTVGNSLVFYTAVKSRYLLYFLSGEQTVFQLPKITSINSDGESVIVSTAAGDVIVYVNGVFYCKMQVSKYPVTAVAIRDGMAYYSLLSGSILSVKIRRSIYHLGFLLALLALVIGLILAYFRK